MGGGDVHKRSCVGLEKLKLGEMGGDEGWKDAVSSGFLSRVKNMDNAELRQESKHQMLGFKIPCHVMNFFQQLQITKQLNVLRFPSVRI